MGFRILMLSKKKKLSFVLSKFIKFRNANTARREYTARFPNRRLPNKKIFTSTFQKLWETSLCSITSLNNRIFVPLQKLTPNEHHIEVVRSNSLIKQVFEELVMNQKFSIRLFGRPFLQMGAIHIIININRIYYQMIVYVKENFVNGFQIKIKLMSTLHKESYGKMKQSLRGNVFLTKETVMYGLMKIM